MKLLLSLVVVSLVAAAWAETPRAKLNKYHTICKNESGVSEDLLNSARKFKKVEDPKLQKHALCLLVQDGYIDSSGDFQVETMKTKFKEGSDNPEDVDKFVDKCAVKKDTPLASSSKFIECLLEYYPS
ncbi:B1 protein-like [Tenebrio molitor]|uniref:B1 protein-like n=1 Tax=Tenebrio molitor TaxID=7067 RepID=UPI001C39F19F|nr:unnamed protein product [Tenebrio molitor]